METVQTTHMDIYVMWFRTTDFESVEKVWNHRHNNIMKLKFVDYDFGTISAGGIGVCFY